MCNESLKMSKYKEYEDYVEDLANRIDALLKIYEELPRTMPAGSVLQLEEDDGNQLQVSKRQLKTMKTQLIDTEIRRNLLKMLKQASKRKRNIKPSDFRGPYTPVIVADGIRKFIEFTDFGHVDPSDPSSPKLIDSLHCIRRGYGLRNSFQALWFISVYNNNIQDEEDKTTLIANDAITRAFSEYPAIYTNYVDVDGKIKKKTNDEKLSTFEVLEKRYSSLDPKVVPFDRKKFRSYVFPTILSINIFNPTDLSQELCDTLKREDIKTQLLKECELIRETKEKWKEFKLQQKLHDKNTST